MRREFPASVKRAAWERSKGHCESCTARLAPGRTHYDHVVPDQLGGEPVLENCEALCHACHDVKTRTQDVPAIARAKRRESIHRGFKAPSRRPMPCGRNSPFRKTMSGAVVRRETRHDH